MAISWVNSHGVQCGIVMRLRQCFPIHIVSARAPSVRLIAGTADDIAEGAPARRTGRAFRQAAIKALEDEAANDARHEEAFTRHDLSAEEGLNGEDERHAKNLLDHTDPTITRARYPGMHIPKQPFNTFSRHLSACAVWPNVAARASRVPVRRKGRHRLGESRRRGRNPPAGCRRSVPLRGRR